MAEEAIQISKEDLASAIVAAMKKQNIGGPQQNTTTGNNQPSFGGFSSKNTSKSADGFINALNQGGGSVTAMAKNVTGTFPIFNKLDGVVGGTVGYIEDTMSAFQALSKVGGGFNGDLGALRAGAASTRMGLDQFANMVGRSTTQLTTLGGTVNQGARRFADLSRNMFEGDVAQGMLNLGYSVEGANEMLLENASLLSRQQYLSGMRDDEVTAATLNMAENLAVMAEITGKSAEAEKDKMIDAARDGKNMAANRRLEMQGITDATQTFGSMQIGLAALGPAAQAFASDVNQTGVPMSDMTKSFASLTPRTAEVIRSMQAVRESNMTTAQKEKELRRLGVVAQQTYAKEMSSSTNTFVATTGQISKYGAAAAEQLENFAPTLEAVERLMHEEGISREEATKRLNEEARNQVRAQSAGGSEPQALMRSMNEANLLIRNAAARINEEIAANLSGNTKLQKEFATTIEGLGKFVNNSAGLLETGLEKIGDRPTIDKNLDDTNNFRSLFEPIVTSAGLTVTDANVEKILGNMNEEFKKVINNLLETTPRNLGGPVLAGMGYKVGETGPETFVPGMDGAIIPNMKSIVNRLPDIAKQSQQQMSSTIQEFAKQMQTTSVPISEEVKQAAAQMQSSGSIEEKLDILNQTMLQLVGINNMQTQIGQKQIKAFKHSGNLMGGIGRV